MAHEFSQWINELGLGRFVRDGRLQQPVPISVKPPNNVIDTRSDRYRIERRTGSKKSAASAMQSELGLGRFVRSEQSPLAMAVHNAYRSDRNRPHKSAQILSLYRGLENISCPDEIFRNAEIFADQFNIEEPAALDFLYRSSRHSPLSTRAVWEQQVRIACSIDRLMRIIFKGVNNEFDQMVNQPACDEFFQKSVSSRGTLLLTYHGGFVNVALKLFAANFFDAGGVIQRRNQASEKGCWVTLGGDSRENLFRALRMLQSGGTVLIVPDGPIGSQTVPVNILGKATTFGEGAAFLAYTSSCDVAWYTVAQKEKQFFPIVLHCGPRNRDESYEEFRNRIYGFYAERIEKSFTGDPLNIVLRRRWAQVFGPDF